MLISLSDSLEIDEADFYKAFSIHERCSLRFYSSLNMAVSEWVHGKLRLFPHKKKWMVIGPGSPFLPPLLSFLSGEGQEVKYRSWHQWQEEKELTEFDKDLLAVVYVEDDAITGELFPCENLVKHCSSQRVYSLGVSHKAFLAHPERLSEHDPFASRVLDFDKFAALGVLGSRSKKLPSLLLAEERFTPESWQTFQEAKKGSTAFDSDPKALEEALGSDWESYFVAGEPRIKDRLVGRVPQIDALSILQMIAELNGNTDFESWGVSGSNCQWGGLRGNSWIELKPSCPWPVEELLVIDIHHASLLETHLKEAVAQLKKLMGL